MMKKQYSKVIKIVIQILFFLWIPESFAAVDDIFYAPGHPYTRGLLRSMPRVDAESYERLIPIEGTPVDMLNPPEGCPFAPRCESAMKICLQKMPPYVELGDNHRAACWLCVQEQMKAQKAAEKNNEKTEAGSHE